MTGSPSWSEGWPCGHWGQINRWMDVILPFSLGPESRWHLIVISFYSSLGQQGVDRLLKIYHAVSGPQGDAYPGELRSLVKHQTHPLLDNLGGMANVQGAVSIRKTVLPGMAIPMLKIRRPNGRLIFNMEIAIRRYIRWSLYCNGAQEAHSLLSKSCQMLPYHRTFIVSWKSQTEQSQPPSVIG